MRGGGVGGFPHQGYPPKHPLTDWVLVVDHIHEWGLGCLHSSCHASDIVTQSRDFAVTHSHLHTLALRCQLAVHCQLALHCQL